MEKARINIRLDQEIKAMIEEAASITGMSLTDFLVSSAKEKAEQAVEQHNSFLASRRDREMFFNALMNPVEPNDRLTAAAAKYKKVDTDPGNG